MRYQQNCRCLNAVRDVQLDLDVATSAVVHPVLVVNFNCIRVGVSGSPDSAFSAG